VHATSPTSDLSFNLGNGRLARLRSDRFSYVFAALLA
jgi:hypothetical protein